MKLAATLRFRCLSIIKLSANSASLYDGRMNHISEKVRVTVAGASGFVGAQFLASAPKNWQIHALARGKNLRATESMDWRQADLFSLQSSTAALESTDVAVYLVHSMLPSTRLFQGSFSDADLLIADNFANACLKNNVKQIIYLGGLVPTEHISKHLASRQEVEEVFKATGIPCTILRAGMVAGRGGSSFEILRSLVTNLPAMILPQWTQVNTQVVYIDDLVRTLSAAVNNQEFFHTTIDVVNGESLNYEKLIRTTCAALGKKRWLLRVPIRSTAFSKLWVSIFGNASRELVSPLIDSLLCELPQKPPVKLIAEYIHFPSFAKMLEVILKKSPPDPRKKAAKILHENSVRSIQRLPSVPQLDCEEIAKLYESWLPKASLGLIRVRTGGDGIIKFCFGPVPWPLLVLGRTNKLDSGVRRIKFHIIGGFLSKRTDCGWLEFRQIADRKFTLASIHEFVPTLPWYIYRFSQAILHKRVMMAFGRSLLAKKS